MRRRGGKGEEVSPGESDSVWEKEKEGKEKKMRKQGRKRGKIGERERENFLVFRWSKFDGARIKIGPRNESYMWVLTSVGFYKLQEVGVLSYFGYS